jgi:TolA-binding protein
MKSRLARTLACALTIVALAAPGTRAQSAGGSSDEEDTKIKATSPVKALLRVGTKEKTVTLVGRTQNKVAYKEGGSSTGQKLLEIGRVEFVDFEVRIDELELRKATRRRQWEKATSVLLQPVTPTLYYLDMPNNNTAERAYEAGDYAMRDADLRYRLARTDEEEDVALEKYKLAYTIFKYAGKADWSPVGQMSSLKGCKCLLMLGKPKTARRYFETIDPPMPGDRAYGLYWLVKAQLDVKKKSYLTGMEAAVKSLCFENKDVDTFPDALLLSARCYEELQQWHRARDVYYEVAKIFPRTDWADAAVDRLKFIVEKELTVDAEKSPIENVFFGLKEDMNGNVETLLEAIEQQRAESTDREYEEDEFEEEEDEEEDEEDEGEE